MRQRRIAKLQRYHPNLSESDIDYMKNKQQLLTAYPIHPLKQIFQ